MGIEFGTKLGNRRWWVVGIVAQNEIVFTNAKVVG
jgi:hypothetical protein